MSGQQQREVNLMEPLQSVDGNPQHVAVNEDNVKALIKTVTKILNHGRNNMQQHPTTFTYIDGKIKEPLRILIQITTSGIASGIFKSDTKGVLSAKMKSFGSDSDRVNKLLAQLHAEDKLASNATGTAFSPTEAAAIVAEPVAGEEHNHIVPPVSGASELQMVTQDGGLVGFNKKLKELIIYLRDENGKVIETIKKKIETSGSWRETALNWLKKFCQMIIAGVVIGTLYVVSKVYGWFGADPALAQQAPEYTYDNGVDYSAADAPAPAVTAPVAKTVEETPVAPVETKAVVAEVEHDKSLDSLAPATA